MADKNLLTLFNNLTKEWQAKKLDQTGRLLEQLKVPLTTIKFLPTDSPASKQELTIAREILEIGAQYSAYTKDIPSFERYFAQLKCYYFDFKDQIPESAFKYQLLGLNLLSLLAQNRVADFHTELELLSVKELQNNIYISHPISLEQWLMEGSYNKVFISKDEVPAPTYTPFIEILLNTIREEIANCIETAYETISLNETARMLYFKNGNELNLFIVKRGWKVDQPSQSLVFVSKDDKAKQLNAAEIPAEMLTLRAIDYAKELEMIH